MSLHTYKGEFMYKIFEWEVDEVELEYEYDLQFCEIDPNWELEGVYYDE